jgi:hypothetical protein
MVRGSSGASPDRRPASRSELRPRRHPDGAALPGRDVVVAVGGRPTARVEEVLDNELLRTVTDCGMSASLVSVLVAVAVLSL